MYFWRDEAKNLRQESSILGAWAGGELAKLLCLDFPMDRKYNMV
jgi:hypothetical protein